MATKSSSMMFVVYILAAALASSAPTSFAQLLPNLPPLIPIPILPPILGGGGNPSPPNLGGILSPIRNLTQITGTVLCSANATANGTSPARPFANATVELQCGGIRVAITTTNSSGFFAFLVDIVAPLLNLVFQVCRTVVTTPLSNCNSTLPSSGVLVSPLQSAGNGSLCGGVPIGNITAVVFQLV